ncbi:MAG: S9 family peptidase [Cyclobacteriaceae bacterium]
MASLMKSSRTLLFLVFCFILNWEISLAQTYTPSFEEVISLRSAGAVVLSPDGKLVAFTVQSTDWVENRYDQEIWFTREGQKPYQLTNTAKGSSSSPAFSPDGQWLAFIADRGNKSQIFALRTSGGEARAFTQEPEGISDFEWKPDGSGFLFLKPEKESAGKKEREKRYGQWEADDREYANTHLWEIGFQPELRDESEMPCYESTDSAKVRSGCLQLPKSVRLTDGHLTIINFHISPDGSQVAYTHQKDPLINSGVSSNISVMDLKTHTQRLIVSNLSSDALEDWSPDSKEILISTNLSDTVSNYFTNSKLVVVNVATGSSRRIAADIDEDLGGFIWRKAGIYGACWNKTKRPVYRIDPLTGISSKLTNLPEQIFALSFDRSGEQFAFTGRNGNELGEVFTSPTSKLSPRKLSDFGKQIGAWRTARSEVIRWKSKDGAEIEGVLHLPSDYVQSRKYPLLVVIHGGPTGIDTPTPVPGYVYPILQWLDKGAIVLRVNYRGSAGYGEAFRSLNVRNLGIGDSWDVMSGVDHLSSLGMIDTTRMGCMGWSQGGYISAFLTTTTHSFKAISVGAGISDWSTYYVNTDIHPFTRQYLISTPWSDPDIYSKTSPIHYIGQASTPTLIQHGEFDRRVPIANGYELLQGLRDHGVPAELYVYKGFGHGINKPKERLAATWHNWQWFGKYIWGEEINLPLGEQNGRQK